MTEPVSIARLAAALGWPLGRLDAALGAVEDRSEHYGLSVINAGPSVNLERNPDSGVRNFPFGAARLVTYLDAGARTVGSTSCSSPGWVCHKPDYRISFSSGGEVGSGVRGVGGVTLRDENLGDRSQVELLLGLFWPV